MRLAIVTHKVLHGDGQARVNYEIARQAAEDGWQVTLVTGELAPELQAHPNITWHPVRWSNRYSSLVGVWNFARHSGEWLRAHADQFDVVHVNGFVTRAPGDVNAAHFVHSAWLRSPLHTWRTNRNAYGAYQWLFTRCNVHWEQQAFRQARVIVAVSGRVRQELRTIGVPDEQIVVIGNGVDLQEFQPGVENRVALGLPAGVPLALFAGDLRLRRKNLDTVLKTLPHVPGLHLAVCGTVQGSSYPAMAAQLGVEDRVHFLGFRSDMPALMRACNFLTFPSRYEPFGLVLLEALASGLPVLTAATAGGAEIITPDCGHVLTDPDDVAGFAAALNAWIAAPARLKEMSLEARRVAAQHCWANMADAYLRLYREVVAARNSVRQPASTTAPHWGFRDSNTL